jgi:glutathione S-transferase
MLKVHGAGGSPFVRKVRVALMEKNVPYELIPVIPINVSAEFKKISPLGKIPVLQDGERTLPDSSAILAYLERVHPTPALYPRDPWEFGRALWFEEYADTAMINVIGAKIFFPKVIGPLFLNRPTDQEAVNKAIAEDLPPLFDYLESQLTAGGWFAGTSFSIADIGVASPLVNFGHAGYSVDAARWPRLADFAARAHGRGSFKTLIEEEKQGFPQAA